jgi:AcrR family transcriptional regulator
MTVDVLLEATARVLVKEGYDRASTNKIAATAGVSIGSLYQYFPSKEALVAGVIERHTRRVSEVVRDTLDRIAAAPIEVALRAFVVIGVESHRVDPKLHGVLSEQVPRAGGLRRVEVVDRNTYGLVRGYFEAHKDEIGVGDLDMAAFICVTTIEALTHTAVLRRPETLAGTGAAHFIDEVTGLLLRYLRPS